MWWFYLYWLPLYLVDARGFTKTEMAWTLSVVYVMADIGSVDGGWISGWLIRRGWPQGKARKTAMALCACCQPVAAMTVFASQPLLAVALVSLATAGHQGWSANLYTTMSDVFPKTAVASVTGIGGCMGGIGGFLFSAIIPGYVIKYVGYTPAILVLGCFHLTALFVVHKTMGKMERIQAA